MNPINTRGYWEDHKTISELKEMVGQKMIHENDLHVDKVSEMKYKKAENAIIYKMLKIKNC